ncbi:siderophore-interacting protein [Martelella endophytica]|uniref:Side tail fiber protein n=1 Tax=Martelella endophytica TaxID=1486262 RepID=A0A0D5LTQ1_MAREN|nr:siderophore-interacting protein [Martelella endophytica]AJY46753.1 side tail fiber protein [Martelella endophytica]
MNAPYSLSGTAKLAGVDAMLAEIAEHFVEHAAVARDDDRVTLTEEHGQAVIAASDGGLSIALSAVSAEALQIYRTMLAEHLYYFARNEPFELHWTNPPPPAVPANLYEGSVVSTAEITPHMLRVIVAVDDVTPFIGGDMHVRFIVPPPGRAPVWPVIGDDGRIVWPSGDDALLVRAYTIRAVDAERNQLAIDFLQHPMPGVDTPGADFAQNAKPGDRVALMGPGSGEVPKAQSILLIGDETALPAIARIAAEVPEGTRLEAIIEVENAAEEQPLPTRGELSVCWLHRADYPQGAETVLANEAIAAIAQSETDRFVWAACEKADIRIIRRVLKERGHERRNMYVAWYWARGITG